MSENIQDNQGQPGIASSTQAMPSINGTSAENDKTFAVVAYALSLATILLGITSIIAVIICYVKRGSGSDMIESHYRFHIRTFWISLLAAIILLVGYTLAFALMFVGIGYVLLPLVGLAGIAFGIWFYTRLIVGLVRILRHEPIANPASWLIG